MNRRRTNIVAAAVGAVLAVAGLVVVAYFVLIAVAMANFGSNK